MFKPAPQRAGTGAGQRNNHGVEIDGEAAAPVFFENSLDGGGCLARGQDIEVVEADGRVESEVLVADVAAADHARATVADHGLVVHAAVELAEAGEDLQRPEPAAAERVEQLDGDARVAIEGAEGGVAPAGVDVVEQQAYLHPAIGGGEDVVGEQGSGLVIMPEVVLEIERPRGGVRQVETGGERVGAGREQPDGRNGWRCLAHRPLGCSMKAQGRVKVDDRRAASAFTPKVSVA